MVVCWALGKMSSWLCTSTAHRSLGNQGCWRRVGGWSKARPIAIVRAVTPAGRCRFMSSICHFSIQYGLWSVLRARSKTTPGWEMFRLISASLWCGRDQRAKKTSSRRAKRRDEIPELRANRPGQYALESFEKKKASRLSSSCSYNCERHGPTLCYTVDVELCNTAGLSGLPLASAAYARSILAVKLI